MGIGGLNALQGAGAVITTGGTTASPTGALSSRVVTSRTAGIQSMLQYQESPTITYAPLSGQALISQLAQPFSLPTIAALSEGNWPQVALLTFTLDWINPSQRDSDAGVNELAEIASYGALTVASMNGDLSEG
jgi:hypothetical protein